MFIKTIRVVINMYSYQCCLTEVILADLPVTCEASNGLGIVCQPSSSSITIFINMEEELAAFTSITA